MVKDVSEYSCMEYVAPFWKGDAVYAESVFVLENALGEIRPFRLAYPVRKVISVRSADLRTTYEQNMDYRVNEYGELEIIRGGRIPYMEWKDYRFPVFDSTRDDRIASADALGAQLVGELFSDREGIRAYSLAVSYTHEESTRYDITKGKQERFVRVMRLLKEKHALTVASYGDSITYGWAASGMQDIRKPPFCKPYAEMVVDALGQKYAADVRHVNCAVSGKCTDWGLEDENIASVTQEKPDLVILAFGMNDAGVFRPEVFEQNLRGIISKIRKACPQTEFLLISPILPNPNTAFTAGSSIFNYHREYPHAFLAIERDTEGVGYANVTAVHERLLERKNLRDTLSNNVNHPNDFMHRVYAQVALKTLLGDEFS